MSRRFAATVAVAATVGLTGACNTDSPPGQGFLEVERDPSGPAAQDVCAGAEREHGALRWMHDDYDRALACARARRVPLMVDMWAPWCHTCLSMQAYVLTDPQLAAFDPRFVFLGLDTDRDVNAAAVAKFPPAAWPTYFVVSSVDESIQARFVGSSSVEQFAAFLADGERGHLALGGATLPPADAHARDGDQAAQREDWAAAATAYEAALAAAPPAWIRRPDMLVSLIGALTRQHDWAGCAAVAIDRMNDTGSAASASDFTSYALGCADELEHETPGSGATLRQAIVARLTALTADATAPLSVDDRSDALNILREALDGLGRKDEARTAAEAQRALLDDAAAKARDPLVASTYNWPRSEVYLYLGIPLELVPALEQSAAALPDEYDPPYRVAWVYWQAGKLDDARRWINRALALVYGPRKTRALAMLAEIEHARGDVEAERAARQQIITTWESIPVEARSEEAIAKAKADLAAVGAGSGSGSGSGS